MPPCAAWVHIDCERNMHTSPVLCSFKRTFEIILAYIEIVRVFVCMCLSFFLVLPSSVSLFLMTVGTHLHCGTLALVILCLCVIFEFTLFWFRKGNKYCPDDAPGDVIFCYEVTTEMRLSSPENFVNGTLKEDLKTVIDVAFDNGTFQDGLPDGSDIIYSKSFSGRPPANSTGLNAVPNIFLPQWCVIKSFLKSIKCDVYIPTI